MDIGKQITGEVLLVLWRTVREKSYINGRKMSEIRTDLDGIILDL